MSKYWFDYSIGLGEVVWVDANSLEEAKETLKNMQEDIGEVNTFFELSEGNWEIDKCEVNDSPANNPSSDKSETIFEVEETA
jgi:hypothetical protein